MRRFASKRVRAFTMLSALLLCSAACEDQRGVRIGDTAPYISGRDLQGNPITRDRLRGKTVVLYFWTDSCCGDSLKLLEPFYRLNRHRGLELIAINEIDSPDTVRSYASRNRLSFTMLSDDQSVIFKEYRVAGFPTVLILDRKGVVREKILGDMPTAKLEKLIEVHISE